jgi:hypothetical protein
MNPLSRMDGTPMNPPADAPFPAADAADSDLGYEAALPYLNSQPGELELLFSPQHEAPPHER